MSGLTNKEIDTITNEFYSRFCGTNISEAASSVTFVRSESRNEELRGYGCKYSIYVLVNDDMCVVSYAPQHEDFFNKLQGMSASDVLKAIEASFKIKKMQLMKFAKERVRDFGSARILKKSDYPLYEKFFRATSPKADPSGWLREYFEEKAEKEYFAGYLLDGRLVSVCDAPDMPYMEDMIQHTGIATLETERRKGYAKRTAALAAHHLIENGICPQWECHVENIASIALAEAVGYEKFGVAYIAEE